MNQGFTVDMASIYAQSVHGSFQAPPNCVVFIYGTGIGIAIVKGNSMQIVACNGHKINHVLKFPAFNATDGTGLCLHGTDWMNIYQIYLV